MQANCGVRAIDRENPHSNKAANIQRANLDRLITVMKKRMFSLGCNSLERNRSSNICLTITSYHMLEHRATIVSWRRCSCDTILTECCHVRLCKSIDNLYSGEWLFSCRRHGRSQSSGRRVCPCFFFSQQSESCVE